MSYSFSVSAKTKEEAILKAEAELSKVVADQPRHNDDKEQAMQTVKAITGLIAEPSEAGLVTIVVSGSLAWSDAGVYTSANISVQAYCHRV
jgi:hypothetical protein